MSEGFNDYFPVFILVPVVMKLGNVYGRVTEICGFTDVLEDEDNEEGWAAGWREGRDLIERELLGVGVAVGVRRVQGYRDDPSAARRGREEGVEEEEGEEGGLGAYFHRFRNTIEGVETPRWWSGVREARPDWMR